MNMKNLAAVSFLRVAWVWLDRIVLGADGTGLGTTFKRIVGCGVVAQLGNEEQRR